MKALPKHMTTISLFVDDLVVVALLIVDHLVVVALLRTHHETVRRSTHLLPPYPLLPEALGDVDVLCGLLDHQAPLPPQLQHRGQDDQAGDLGILRDILQTLVFVSVLLDNLVVQPELVESQEGARPANTGATVDQHRALAGNSQGQLGNFWPKVPGVR